jgi:hypothetical protein
MARPFPWEAVLQLSTFLLLIFGIVLNLVVLDRKITTLRQWRYIGLGVAMIVASLVLVQFW